MKLIKIYLIAVVIFLALDSLWLGVIAQSMYQEQLGPVVNIKFNLIAAILFYVAYVAGILFFSILPALKEKSWKRGMINGAILGGMCYATYDMTNPATISGWPIHVTIIDIFWGMLITGVAGGITTWISIRINLQMSYSLFMTNADEILGPVASTMSGVLMLVSVFLYFYSKRADKKGWLSE